MYVSYECFVCIMYVYICMHACTYVCMHASMHVCVYACMYGVCMCVCMYVCMYVCYVCMHACMYVCMYVCTYACIGTSEDTEDGDEDDAGAVPMKKASKAPPPKPVELIEVCVCVCGSACVCVLVCVCVCVYTRGYGANFSLQILKKKSFLFFLRSMRIPARVSRCKFPKTFSSLRVDGRAPPMIMLVSDFVVLVGLYVYVCMRRCVCMYT